MLGKPCRECEPTQNKLLRTTDWLYCLQRSSDSGLQVGRLPICFRQEAQGTWAAYRQQPSDELSHPLRIWELYAAECPVLEKVSESRLRPPESKDRVVMLSCLLSRRPRPSTPRELAEGPWHSKNRRCCFAGDKALMQRRQHVYTAVRFPPEC